MTRTITSVLLLRIILGFRLLVLVMLPVQQELGSGFAGHETFWEALAIAVLYTIVLAVFSERVAAFNSRSWAFVGFDLVVVFALYFVTGGPGGWPFFLFGATTILIPGLRGGVGGAVLTAISWSVLTSLAWMAKGVPPGEAFGISSFDDLFNLSFVSAIWAYSIGLMGRLNAKEQELESRSEELAQANAALDEREREIVGLLGVGNAIASRVDLDGILRTVREALDDMGFGKCWVWLVRDGRLAASLAETDPQSLPEVSEGPLPAAVAARRAMSVRPGVDGIAPDELPGVGPDSLAVIVPIVSDAEEFGALVIESVSGTPFTAEDREQLSLFAELIALALTHMRFFELAREQAVADERHRMALEMQSTVVRELAAAAEVADSLVKKAVSPKGRERAQLIADNLRAGMKDLRVAVLNWDSLDWTGGVAETAKRYTEGFSEVSGISVTWDVRGSECGLPPATAKDLLRILQEALANAWRHGNATSAAVTLGFSRDGIDLSVQDDGDGFDVELAEEGAGLGLRSMRARGSRNGGRASIASELGEGTTVSVWIPCSGGAT